jgi:hypothetical protein
MYSYKCCWAFQALSLSGQVQQYVKPYIAVSFETGYTFGCLESQGYGGSNVIRLHMEDSSSVKFKVTLQPTVSRSVCPSIMSLSGTRDQFFFLFTEIIFRHLRFFSMKSPVRLCNYSYECYWALPALSLSRPSRAELVVIS